MHKKTLNLAAICIVIILIVTVYSQKNKNNNARTGNIVIGDEVGGKTAEQSTIDEDDYQQSIFNTIVKQQLASFEKVTDSYKKKPGDTLSDRIAKDVFGEYIQYNTSGNFSEETLKKLASDGVKGEQIPKSKVTIKQIRLAKATVSNLKVYGNNLVIIQNTLAKAIASLDGKKNSQDYLQALYFKIAVVLAKQPVPAPLANYHLAIINSYRDFAYSFTLLALQEKDPARALLGLQNAKTANDTLLKSFAAIQNIIKLNKVVYEKTDPAYGWINQSENSTIITTQ